MDNKMKINDLNVLSASLQNIAKSGSKNDASSVRSTTASDSGVYASGDQVALSSQSRMFSQALTAGEATRTSRIDQLRALYVQNEHEADPLEVGDAIINAHLSGG